jgi:hypothetical protein
MMMLKIGQLYYLHSKNFRGGRAPIFFAIPKANSYRQADRQARFLLFAQVSVSKAKKVTKGYCNV